MSFWSLIAGTSWLPACRTCKVHVTPARPPRRGITIPHPELDPSRGQTRLIVRTANRIPSMIHAFAILRAIEFRLGNNVISMEISKDLDTLQPQSRLFLTLLRPVQLSKPLLLEIPSPRISKSSNFLGGPSLEDVQAALRSTQSPIEREQGEGSTGSTSTSEEPLQFRVEPFANIHKGSRRGSVRPQIRMGKEVEEDEEIVEALRQFGGGFYGGFTGLAERFRHLARKNQVEEERERVGFELPSRSGILPRSPSTSTSSTDPPPDDQGGLTQPSKSTEASSSVNQLVPTEPPQSTEASSNTKQLVLTSSSSPSSPSISPRPTTDLEISKSPFRPSIPPFPTTGRQNSKSISKKDRKTLRGEAKAARTVAGGNEKQRRLQAVAIESAKQEILSKRVRSFSISPPKEDARTEERTRTGEVERKVESVVSDAGENGKAEERGLKTERYTVKEEEQEREKVTSKEQEKVREKVKEMETKHEKEKEKGKEKGKETETEKHEEKADNGGGLLARWFGMK